MNKHYHIQVQTHVNNQPRWLLNLIFPQKNTVTSKILLDFKKSPQIPHMSMILRHANMLMPPDFCFKASKTLIADVTSYFFPNSSMVEHNRSWECGKTLAYLQIHKVVYYIASISWHTELRWICLPLTASLHNTPTKEQSYNWKSRQEHIHTYRHMYVCMAMVANFRCHQNSSYCSFSLQK